MPGERVHVTDPFETVRTEDVITNDDTTFRDMLLSPRTLAGLDAVGFAKPSPIQRQAIPNGRCGFDLIVQAKSGTGKTCVFTIIALEMVACKMNCLQVLILSPTREISVQIKDVICSIGKMFEGLNVKTFIGGLPVETDKKNLQKCHIAVGSPGRVKHLIQEGLMKVGAIRLFILDEADKLMDKSFRADVRKQIIATSATYPKDMEDFLVRYMSRPIRISLGLGVFLKGVRQFASVVPYHANLLNQTKIKEAELIRLLSNVSFKQCFVFSNYQTRVESICKKLNKEGFPAVYICGSQSQTIRLKSLEHLKEFNCRVFVSTDLTSRGIDAENVNLVINMDVPHDSSTYMHRIGRAGRYGTHGLAITIVESGDPCARFQRMLYEISGYDFQIHIFPPGKLNSDVWKMSEKEFETLPILNGEDEAEAENLNKQEEKGKNDEKREEIEEKVVPLRESKTKSVKLKSFEELVASYSKSDCELMSFDELVDLDKRFKEKCKADDEPFQSAFKLFQFAEFPKEILSSLNSIRMEDLKLFEEKIKNPKKPVISDSLTGAEQRDNREWREKAERPSDSDEKVIKSNRDTSEDNMTEDEEEEEDCGSSCSSCGSDDHHYNLAVSEESYRKWFIQWQAQVKLINDYVNHTRSFRVFKCHPTT